MIIGCSISVLSRSSLNIIDRYLFGRQISSFRFLYFSSVSFPFIYGFSILAFFGNISLSIDYFLSIGCFFLALTTNLVGLSFSYAFRHKEVRHIVLFTKIPEFLLPFFLFLPFFSEEYHQKFLSWKNFIPLFITWISLIPYLFNKTQKKILLDKTFFYLVISLLLQMIVSSIIATSMNSISEVLAYTVALLLWRCILSIPLNFIQHKKENFIWNSLSIRVLGLLAFRGIIALSTQFTFNWAITEANPLIVWPILNTTIILSSLGSQFFLKETLHYSDWIALIGIFVSSSLIQVI